MKVLPFIAATIAFLLLALATDRHHRARLGGPCPARRRTMLRVIAWGLIAAGLPLAVLCWGAVFGPIGWVGAVMLGAALVFCGLNFLPARTGR